MQRRQHEHADFIMAGKSMAKPDHRTIEVRVQERMMIPNLPWLLPEHRHTEELCHLVAGIPIQNPRIQQNDVRRPADEYAERVT